jgi:Lipocalin-like domain
MLPGRGTGCPLREDLMKQHLIPFAFVAFPFAISSTAQAQQAITPDQLVGVWKLQSIVNHDLSTGKDTISPLSLGYLTFVRQGKKLRASVNYSAPDRKEADTHATDAEAIQLFNSYVAYSGVVELGSTATAEGTPITTTIDVDMEPSGIGPHPRTYVLNGTKFTVITKQTSTITTAVFEKVE